MCKLISISGLSLKSYKQASRLVVLSSELLGASQKDGFGYSLSTSKTRYQERYVKPESCKGMGVTKASMSIVPGQIRFQEKEGVDFDTHGEVPSKGIIKGNFIAHGRTATCEKSVTNTHPFTGFNDEGQWTICHNGIVSWKGDALPLQTTCDSEHLLNCFLHLEGEQSFKDRIAGYLAIVGFNPEGELFVMRDNKAPLYCSWIKELNVFVNCTDSTHCKKITDFIIECSSLKGATVSEPMMLESFVKTVFKKDGTIETVMFDKFDENSPYVSPASVYRSLGSAGATAYKSRYESGKHYDSWDYDSYGSYNKPSTTTPPATPTQLELPAGVSEEDLLDDDYRKEMMLQYKKNAYKQHKPWKDKR